MIHLGKFPRSIGMGGVGFGRRRASLHPLTLDYIARLQAAGGHLPQYDAANDYLIRELSALGGPYWDTMGTLTTLCAKGFDGLMVPLRDGMDVGEDVNFVEGNLNPATGLKGDGENKNIASGFSYGAETQNNAAQGVYVTADRETATGGYINNGAQPAASMQLIGNSSGARGRANSSTLMTFGDSTALGYTGLKRDNNLNVQWRAFGQGGSIDNTSTGVSTAEVAVFSRTLTGGYTSARLSLYHAGPGVGLDLAVLDGIFTAFMARVAAA